MMFRENGWAAAAKPEAIVEHEIVDGFQLTRLRLCKQDLPDEFVGYRLLQLSDLHFGPATSSDHIRRAIAISQTLSPDLTLFTGDYLQLTSVGIYPVFATKISPRLFRWKQYRREIRRKTEDLAELIAPLQPTDGSFAVLGNHDYMEGAGTIRRKLGEHIHWLINDTIAVERGDATLLIGGIDDDRYGKPDLSASLDFARHLPDHRRPAAKILLAHNPDVVTYRNSTRLNEVDLVLSGHTHGGQICLPRFGPLVTRTRQKNHIRGLSWFQSTPVYVSNGVGYGAFALRVLCPPELVLIELSRSK